MTRILQACGTLASSGQVAPVLFSLLDRDDLTTQGYVAVAGGAKAIASSSEKEVVLLRYAKVAPCRPGPLRFARRRRVDEGGREDRRRAIVVASGTT